MANQIAAVLKTEITRLARKEIRAEVSSLKKASAQHRSTIAALRREVDALKKQLRRTAVQRAEPAPQTSEPVRRRFRVGGLIAHRKMLGLSAQDYGKLVGVSGQTIYHWEDGQHPRAAQLEALASVRGLGKREAAQRLEELANSPSPSRTRKASKRK